MEGKVKYVLIAMLTLSGCSEKVYPKNLKALENYCKAHGGWANIEAATVLGACGRCADGTFWNGYDGSPK